MTALHWAAYNDDLDVTKLLLSCNALQLLNIDGNAPVDIAAICNNWNIVKVFADDFNLRD